MSAVNFQLVLAGLSPYSLACLCQYLILFHIATALPPWFELSWLKASSIDQLVRFYIILLETTQAATFRIKFDRSLRNSISGAGCKICFSGFEI